ncbi:acyltransferase [uncultured Phascolarctobacterium sp.]|uniref:acyltransferase n=1 Tax=uncultured Phascolarctobacterium sp. TaxID=512296 RepID=UPI0025DD2AD6|nr:acyltransferase [uncultured Phascolarctobacterium sp.]
MRNKIIDNMRGLCMLGVIGIHIGSLALAPNSFTLYLLLEILSRYSVPSFFFISGYGLACTDKGLLTGSALNYIDFMKKRLCGAGLPYVSWSLLYMLYFWLILPPGFVSWEPLHVAFVLFFGLGCYHLYFMVILLWFYGTYPLWRKLLRIIIHHNHAFMLVLLFIFQLLFNWWTTHPGVNSSSWSVLAKNFFDYRLNYLPLHYLLIFIGGGLAAVYWEKFLAFLHKYAAGVIVLYLASIGWDVYSCYDAVKSKGYSLLDLANTYHQLSPQGLVYTIGSILFFCLALAWLERKANRAAGTGSAPAALLYKAISLLSSYSMLIYFVHPLLLDWITSAANYFGIIMTVKKVTLAYVLLVCSSLALSVLLTRLFAKCSTAKLLFTGKR